MLLSEMNYSSSLLPLLSGSAFVSAAASYDVCQAPGLLLRRKFRLRDDATSTERHLFLDKRKFYCEVFDFFK